MPALREADVAQCLTPHAAVFGFPLTEALCSAWKVALVDALTRDGINPVTAQELRQATEHHLYTSRFRMTPGDAWAYIKETRRVRADTGPES